MNAFPILRTPRGVFKGRKRYGMNDPIGQAKAILKRYFGYDTLWPLQEEIIGHVQLRECGVPAIEGVDIWA